MADKTLNDVVKSLKSIDTTLKKPAVQTASDKEASEEAARDAKESKQIQKDILATLRGAHGAASGADKKKGGLIAGLLGGIGAGLGTIAKGIAKIGPKFVLGMGSLAAGIVAFMVGLGGGAKIAQLIGIDGESLKTLVSNTFGAFSGTDLIAMGAVIGAAMLMDKAKVSKVGVALGMGAIGIGIASFTLGILAAEGFAKIGDLIALDGSSLNKLMTNVFGAFEGIEVKDLAAILVGAVVAFFIINKVMEDKDK